jgi:hypothetical protein
LTRGIVRCVDTKILPPDPHHTINHVVVKPVGAAKDFSDHGDSGSVICDDKMRVVALLWGGPETRGVGDGNKYTFGTPISFVEQVLRIRVATNPPMKVWRVPGESAETRLHREVAGTEAGRELLAAYGRHEDEVRTRLRNDRRFVVAWHRGHGPALARSITDLAWRRTAALPSEVDGVPWDTAVTALAASLRGLVSARMVADLERWVPVVAGLGGAAYEAAVAAVVGSA